MAEVPWAHSALRSEAFLINPTTCFRSDQGSWTSLIKLSSIIFDVALKCYTIFGLIYIVHS